MFFIFWVNVKEKIIFFKNKIRFSIAGQYFGKVEQNLSHQKLGYILSTFDRPSQGDILWEQSLRGISRVLFPLYTGVAPPIYVPTTNFKLMTLQNIRIKEALLSKGASVTMKQTSHPV